MPLNRVCKKCYKVLSRPDAPFCNKCGKSVPSEVEIFVSYAHEDATLRNQLAIQLSALGRQGLATIWHDQNISSGQDWMHAIRSHLEAADIILLLVSPDFIASDFSYSMEMQQAMDRHFRNEAYVIPVILRHVDWHQAPFAVLQALPRGAKPVKAWSNRDEALLEVVKGIKKAIEGCLFKGRSRFGRTIWP